MSSHTHGKIDCCVILGPVHPMEIEFSIPPARIMERGLLPLAQTRAQLEDWAGLADHAITTLAELLAIAKARGRLIAAQLDALDALAGRLPDDAA